MSCLITSINYSPIKSLSFQRINTCEIKKNIGILGDRIFAFSRNVNLNEAKSIQDDPKQRKLNNFLTLKNSPVLNKYNFKFENDIIFILKDSEEIVSFQIQDKEAIIKKLLELEPNLPSPTYLLKNELFPFYDSSSNENISNTISLINLNSIKDFQKKINKEIEFERFRGNIYIQNLDAFEENKWINKVISINNIEFKVLKHIPRCSATNLKINSDNSDINLPYQLQKIYNHKNMGIYLFPLDNGKITIGDKVKFN